MLRILDVGLHKRLAANYTSNRIFNPYTFQPSSYISNYVTELLSRESVLGGEGGKFKGGAVGID